VRVSSPAQIGAAIAAPEAISIEAGNIMSRVLAALSTAAVVAFAAAPASAGCAL